MVRYDVYNDLFASGVIEINSILYTAAGAHGRSQQDIYLFFFLVGGGALECIGKYVF